MTLIRVADKWKTTTFILLLIVFLAFVLRIVNLTILPVFADEAIYIRWSQIMANEPTLRFLPLSDGKQPLFMWVLMFLIKYFSDPLFAGRLVSVVSGLGSIFAIFTLSLIIFNSRKVALVSTLIYALSPFSLFFDRMALVDSMLSFFGIWTLVFGVITAKTRRFDFAMLTGFFLGFALLTKSPALFFSLMLPLTFVFFSFQTKKNKFTVKLGKPILLLVVTYTIAYSMYNVLRLGPNFHLIATRNLDYVYPISHLWQRPLDPFLPYFHRSLEWLWILGPSFLVFLILVSVVINFQKYPKEILFLTLWSWLPIITQAMFAKVFTARYIFFSLPTLFILAGSVILIKKKAFKILVWGVFALFVIHSLLIDRLLLVNPGNAPLPQNEHSGYFEEWTSGIGIREIADFIRSEHDREPDRQIVVGTEGSFGTLPDGLQIYLENIPKVTVIGTGSVSIDEIPRQLIESAKFGNKTYLVVNNSRLKKDPEDLGVKLIASYPKAKRTGESHEKTLYGPQEILYLFEIHD